MSDTTPIEVMKVQEYHRRQHIAFDKAWEEYDPKTGGEPQAAFYFWFTNRGNFRESGYCAIKGRSHYWAKTKRAVLERARKG